MKISTQYCIWMTVGMLSLFASACLETSTDEVGMSANGMDPSSMAGDSDTSWGGDYDGESWSGEVEMASGEDEMAAEEEQEPQLVCPEVQDPLVLYLSADDSNSMASPIVVRQKIKEGIPIYPSDIRVYEFLNRYNFNYGNPENKPAAVGLQMHRAPESMGEQSEGTYSLLVSAQGRVIEPGQRRPLNITFSIDTSGSMGGHSIGLVKTALKAFATVLEEGDVVSMVEWDSSTSVPLKSHVVTGPNDSRFLSAVRGLESGGSTDLHGGLVRAYEIARENFSADRINRVVLMSDGGANTGITDIEIIAGAAEDSDGEGIYLAGIGVGQTGYYYEALMDALTDAGKGAYVFLDDEEEAWRQFGNATQFLSIMEVAARNVQLELTLPWYFSMKKFFGEEYSTNPLEVEPQHLAPNDAMSFFQLIEACDSQLVENTDKVKAVARFLDPITRRLQEDEMELSIAALQSQPNVQLSKAEAVTLYALGLVEIGKLQNQGNYEGALEKSRELETTLTAAAASLGDEELNEIAELVAAHRGNLDGSRQNYYKILTPPMDDWLREHYGE